MRGLRSCLVVVAVLGLILQGCGALIGLGAGAAAGIAGEKYVSGHLETTYPVGLNESMTAVQSAMKKSQMEVTDTRMDSTRAQVRGTRMSDGATVTVSLVPLSPTSTKGDIRVGTLGDENAARVLNREIFNSLK